MNLALAGWALLAVFATGEKMPPLHTLHDAVRYRLLLATFDNDAEGPADLFKVLREARHGLSALAVPDPPNEAGEIRYFLGALGELFEEGCLTAYPGPPRIRLTQAGIETLYTYARTLVSG